MADKQFDSFARDKNREIAPVGSGIRTFDATPVAQESPLVYDANGNVVTINVPANAAEIVLRPSTDLRISEDENVNTYFVLPADLNLSIGLGRTETLYVEADSGGGTLNFYFITI